MKSETDKEFFQRADEYIDVANQQATQVNRGKVSASMMFATARFNAWVSASGTESSEDLASVKAEALEDFISEYRKMLEENLDEYIEHFDKYMGPGSGASE
jgi:class 3 adenylate cyclase